MAWADTGGHPTRFLVPAGCGKDGRRGVEGRSKVAKFYGVDYVISGDSERWNRVHQRDRRLEVKRPRSPMSWGYALVSPSINLRPDQCTWETMSKPVPGSAGPTLTTTDEVCKRMGRAKMTE
jgi:hypothetical protein